MKKNFLTIGIVIFGIIILVFYYFRSGSTEYSVSPDKFEQLSKVDGAIILDVRSKFEFGGDKIAGAQNISFTSADFNQQVAGLNKEKTYLVYCATGSRSSGACKVLRELGFKIIYNLSGGIENWKSEGKPVIR